ncbi:MAG: PTS lactose/cellobiose transporter subunit IIA [Peptoniphilaceae bacterium]|nr:PTS lactose/cellobiose transporter subunit IIA [Peptoniphilaceae bacterium]MDD7382814.1 PTS lactose/cellobiose transporter subunit IIA [Peptoniphilaceae bacterium]MDY3738226.1 PTS lactose/cellobiose transporter subunit IIA [Peptoniphilaceae bacterium]
MDKKEAAMIGFQMVAYSGDARSCYIEALREARKGNLDKTEELMEKAKKSLLKAHDIQTKILAKEADDEDLDIGYIMIHGQDHLMSSMLLKDMMEFLLDIYKKEK